MPYTSDEDADVNSSPVGLTHIASECEDGIVDMGASHSAWIAEALECHYSSKFLCSPEFICQFLFESAFSLNQWQSPECNQIMLSSLHVKYCLSYCNGDCITAYIQQQDVRPYTVNLHYLPGSKVVL